MRKITYLLALVLLCSHNLYIKIDSYFLQPDQEATLSLFNGSFDKSENIITRDRFIDASILANGKRIAIDTAQWKDKDSTITQLKFSTDKEGTYVAGASTKARNIELAAEKFNSYLINDGIVDMMEKRTSKGLLKQDAVESYQKHVKAIYQVGNTKTKDWETPLGYPIEFIPQENPYEKYSGENLKVKLLLNSEPLTNQVVYANVESNDHTHTSNGEKHEHNNNHNDEHATDGHSHDTESNSISDEGHTHDLGQKLRTDDDGIVTIDLPKDGIYYLRTIYMTEVENSDVLTHESNWATMSFGVTHKHGADTHVHGEEHEEGIPTWVFILGSICCIVVLFFVFRKK
ncbi:DUF4198 domain-containing protein [Maribacter sp. MAR_2009_72]|uniref:DUF4198 domain-containing protein n=1 Tax=Maribacter sp. MAR_2009_72 TaxID=1250050 RepID=UPI00119933C9|nr:DUF4198 domain-containing protein [Maribacter sp. MAR_2009_72]TVZ14210.1 uncharacterized protein DUF4198 [Maribacter sp. MAR_2009_72]